MPEYKVNGEENEFVIDLPELVDERTKEIIEKTLKKCVDPKNQDKVVQALNKMLSQTNGVIDQLKEDDKYNEKLEEDIRKFVGINMKNGFEVGSQTIQPEEVEIVQKAMVEKMAYEGEVIEDLPEDLQGFARYIFACLELGRISFQTGFIIGIFLSMEKAEKFYQEESDNLSYIR